MNILINKISIRPYKSINDIESLDEANCIHNYIIIIKFFNENFNVLNQFCILTDFLNLQRGENNGYTVDIDLINKFINLYSDNYFQRITILLYPFNDDYLFHCYLTDCLDINSTIYQAHIKDNVLYINNFYYIDNKIYKKFKNYISALHLLNRL